MLQVQNISVNVGSKSLLKNVSLEVHPGKLVALIGPNGAGKSTLLKSIAGDIPYKGEVALNGQLIKTISAQDKATFQAVMTQKSAVNFQFTVEEITLMGRYPHFDHQPTAKDWQVVHRQNELLALSEKENQIHYSLSGGEQQRNHFARILAQLESEYLGPKLMLLDEPLNNLDIEYQHKIMEITTEFVAKGNAALVVMHDINMAAAFADELVLLKNGEILTQGAVDEVLTSQNLRTCYNMNACVHQHPFLSHKVVYFQPLNQESIERASALINS
jgi:iron complex transport system ATP-binding protein